MVITIRTSGGKGYIRANTTGDPTQGEQVAEFTFAEGGTTEVKFTKAVNTQDLLLWVPSDSLPQTQLSIEKVEVFYSASIPITDPRRAVPFAYIRRCRPFFASG